MSRKERRARKAVRWITNVKAVEGSAETQLTYSCLKPTTVPQHTLTLLLLC